MIEHALRPLFSYLQAVVVPTGVFAATEDFGATAAPGQSRLSERVERAAAELMDGSAQLYLRVTDVCARKRGAGPGVPAPASAPASRASSTA